MKYQKRTWITLVFSTVIIITALFTVCILGAGAITSSAPGDYKADLPESTPTQSVSPSAEPAATEEPAYLTTPEPTADPAAAQSVLPSATPAATSPPPLSGEVIVFEDPIMEKVIRAKLDKPEGPVTDQDMLKITTFKFTSDSIKSYKGKIKTLDDLRWCENLMYFTLWDTNITDISALSGTRDLVEFQCQARLGDITPLLGNTNLRTITLMGITDSGFRELMANCDKLYRVRVSHSDVSSESIRILADRYELSELRVNDCGITDISPFAGFTGLEYLSLEDNLIEDISPLAENPQLSKQIDLSANKITDWSPLENMRALMYLAVGRNPVTESPVLDKLEENGCKIYR